MSVRADETRTNRGRSRTRLTSRPRKINPQHLSNPEA